jgi:hypothetical protein
MGGLIMRLRNLVAVACMASALLFAVGCYETKYPLGSQDKAIVDPAYVGDFVLPDNDKKSETIIIRNIDNRLYYVEWLSEDDKPLRMVGYTADVNGVTFANLRKLTDDGSIDDDFLIIRLSISDDHSKLSLRNLKAEFFTRKDKKIDSSEAQEKVIADNLENSQMYDGDTMVATRVPPATQP